MTFRIEIQEMKIRDRLYQVVAGNLFGAWQAAVYRDGEKIAGPREFASENDAKATSHMYAFRDAGFFQHVCFGDCAPWQSMRLTAAKAVGKGA